MPDLQNQNQMLVEAENRTGAPQLDTTTQAGQTLEQLAEQAAEVARSQSVVDIGPIAYTRSKPLTAYLDTYRSILEKSTRYFKAASEKELYLTYAAEWMLDNAYITYQAIRQIGKDLPFHYYNELPRLNQGPYADYPRIYALAREFIQIEKAHLNIDRLHHFTHAYQEITPLTMGELWALPIMLRLSIIQCLVSACGHLTKLISNDNTTTIPLISLLPQVSDEEAVANSITSLRTLSNQDWDKFFEEASLVEQILRKDPSGIYAQMDFETRDQYRKVIEEIALATKNDERQIAQKAVELTQENVRRETYLQGSLDAPAPIQVFNHRPPAIENLLKSHVGYYLLGQGQHVLEESFNYRPAGIGKLKRFVLKHPTVVYLGSTGLITVLLLAFALAFAGYSGGSAILLIMLAVLMVVPALTVSADLVNWIVTHTLKPRILPKMDYEEGIPPEYATLVAIPTLLTSKEEVDFLLKQLELHHLGNPDKSLSFALLSDFPDAPEQDMPGDQEILQYVQEGIRALNHKYPVNFFLFHRKRLYNPKEGVWMGWERKRGKLHELNRLILDKEDSSFGLIDGDIEAIAGIRYVITLDGDTILPRDSAKCLISTITHPLNHAVIDPKTGCVISGYTILQPRTEINPVSANQSWFTRIYSGDVGLDLYSRAVSDVYQDLFGEGIFVGKGVYDVAAFESSLEGRVPDDTLLSHDLFEGIHGRAGLVTDISVVEDYPSNNLLQAIRLSRWIRGDWQLVPWLLPGKLRKILNRYSESACNIPVIGYWKIIDNLRRSLVPPVLLILFVSAWTWLPGSALVWTVLLALTLSVPMLTGFGSAMMRVAEGIPLEEVSRNAFHSSRDVFLRWLLALVFLPYEALLSAQAIFITLVRVFITRRHLLQWTSAAETAHAFGEDLNTKKVIVQMTASIVAVLIIILLVVVVHLPALPVAAPLLLAWLLSPAIAYRISQPIRIIPRSLTPEQVEKLHLEARRTWIFFERFVGPDDHWLPPDHFQESPLGMIAHRTSPTNIGLMLLSSLGAYDLGYIGPMDLAARLRSAVENMDGMERYWGHLLNWYDTRTLDPLAPRYVSTVDSGNLAASLIALKQACLSMQNNQLLRPQIWKGFLDTLSLLTDLVATYKTPGSRKDAQQLYQLLLDWKKQIEEARKDPDGWYLLARWSQAPESNETTTAGEKEAADNNQPASTQKPQSIIAQIDQLALSLAESGTQDLGVENIRRLRLYSRELHLHLAEISRLFNLLAPWVLFLADPPILFNEITGLDPSVAAGWQELKTSFDPQAKLSEIDALCRRGRESIARIQELLNKPIPGFDKEQRQAIEWLKSFNQRLDSASMTERILLIGYEDVARQAEAYIQAMDFHFLFDEQRQIFYIGYNVAAGRLDSNYYDLLASESRLTSLIAIAKGDVPQSHWLHLSRPITQVDGSQALLSWSATMFEYLMPDLLAYSYDGTLLHHSERMAVERQIQYGNEKSVPWGISESGYYRFDQNMFYQYRAFGVPGLGFKRGLGEDLVITPYASLLALPFRPDEVVKNIETLERLGMKGAYGYFEAIDFTPSRVMLGDKYEIIRSYMAHHQGMILVSLLNYLDGDKMVQRFHSDARIQSIQLLLQEQIPVNPPLEKPHVEGETAIRPREAKVVTNPWRVRIQTPQPRVHFLSNGRYGVLITSAGSGYSSWKDQDLTRWRADTTRSNWGTWIYLQDMENDNLWSVGYQPTNVATESRDIYFSAYMAELRRRDYDISASMEITIPPDDDVEIRRVTLTNHGDHSRRLRLTSYGEVVLAAQATDIRHPAFNKLFIESEYIQELNSLVFHRRPRSDQEQPVYMAHALYDLKPSEEEKKSYYETNRLRFLGRGHTVLEPAALLDNKNSLRPENPPEQGPVGEPDVGSVLDPVFSLGQEVIIPAHSARQLVYLTAAGDSRQGVLDLAGRYQTHHAVGRAFDMARSQAEMEMRQLSLDTPQLQRITRVLSLLLYPNNALRAQADTLAANVKGQSGLWGFGISGDYPILLVKISDVDQLSLAQEMLQAHAYWRNRQLKIDLVFLNEKGTDYGQEINSHLYRLLTRMNADNWINRRGGIYVLVADQIGQQDRVLLETTARVILDGNNGLLASQVENLYRLPTRLPAFTPVLMGSADLEPTPRLTRPQDLLYDNGYGGFSQDGREYVIFLEKDRWSPAPWINVIANPDFGFLVSESGSGCTWSMNSGENRLTPWKNDPVSDMPGEALYLRDEETAHVWSPTPLPIREVEPYLIRHGAGYTQFEHNSHGIKQRLRLYTAPDDPVKLIHLRLENTWKRVRRVTATYYAEWVLGVSREASQQFVVPEFNEEHQAILARNAYNVEFGEQVAFASASKQLHGLTADRTEFLGRLGSPMNPAGLRRIGLAGHVEAGVDPCAALQLHIDLPPGGSEEVYFLLGEGTNHEDAIRIIEKYRQTDEPAKAWEGVHHTWDKILGTLTVKTPEPSINLLLNRWLLYQALSCRFWGRTALYQSSGAYGFRDQLQDSMALLYSVPELTREHLLRAARHQFEAGDVLHWWHPPSGRGVRTRISDDLLWLPYVTSRYLAVTGDRSILDEKLPFLKATTLAQGEDERYSQYPDTQETYSLYEHCLRALEKGVTFGPHGLPLIGTGDWNDGLNRVGVEGRGESVWLGWFLIDTLQRFAQVCEERGDQDLAKVHREQADKYQKAIETSGWDGKWYLRAYYDDGYPLGSHVNSECQIDEIAQSWSVLSGRGNPEHQLVAMRSVFERLVKPEDKLILLFTPPFDQSQHDPGYIKGYLPGIRENGGQYTHGSIWTAWAFTQLKLPNEACQLFQIMNPILHAEKPEQVRRYKVEPYVVVADIYSKQPHTGRGGWTWYTGSAAWMYRLGIEAILGFNKSDTQLEINPQIPDDWPDYEVTYQHQDATYHIKVETGLASQTDQNIVQMDGVELHDGKIPLLTDGQTHEIHVIIPRKKT
ncbi:MAG: GH36-type glycosyl hydrolase domain-containing protein [Omnitrophica WOR_2 bacterium]